MDTMTVNELKELASCEVELALAENEANHNETLERTYKEALRLFNEFLDGTVKAQVPETAVYSIFSQLMDQNPLTPIKNVDEEWSLIFDCDSENNVSLYRNKRRLSLYKKVVHEKETEIVSFTDVNRAISVDIDTKFFTSSEIGLTILDEMLPITFPYEPIGKIKIYEERFEYHKKCDKQKIPYDTLGILYFRLSDGQMIKVDRFFKRCSNGTFEEITKQEYLSRKEKKK